MARWRGAALLVLGGCASGEGLFEVDATDRFVQDPDGRTDILFVVDDSASMVPKQERLSAGFAAFADALDAADADFRLGLATTTAPAGPLRLVGDPPVLGPADDYRAVFAERVRVGGYGSDQEKGLEAAVRVLDGADGGVLRRADAQLLVVFVSDEDDCSDDGALADAPPTACYTDVDALVPVDTLVAELGALVEDPLALQLGAIVGPREPTCDDTAPGRRYVEATARTGGFPGDLCAEDWSDALLELGRRGAGLRTTFPLSRAAVPETIEVEVAGVPIPAGSDDGWTWSAATWYLELHGAAVPAPGEEVVVGYVVDGSVPAPVIASDS